MQKAVDEYNRKASAPATSGAAKGTVKAETPIKPVKKTTAAGSNTPVKTRHSVSKKNLSLGDAAVHVLTEAGEPLHYREITRRVLEQGLAEAGFISFGFIEGGFARLLANHPVRGIDDMRRRRRIGRHA